jgi:hypothetical protein
VKEAMTEVEYLKRIIIENYQLDNRLEITTLASQEGT